MFQASFIKRASRQLTKSTTTPIVVGSAAALGIVGLSTLTLGCDDDESSNKNILQQQLLQQQQGLGNKVALCEGSNEKNNSVIGMLGDIQKKVRTFDVHVFFFRRGLCSGNEYTIFNAI